MQGATTRALYDAFPLELPELDEGIEDMLQGLVQQIAGGPEPARARNTVQGSQGRFHPKPPVYD